MLWTKKGVLTKEERRQVRDEQDVMAREVPVVGERCKARILTQPPYDPSGGKLRS